MSVDFFFSFLSLLLVMPFFSFLLNFRTTTSFWYLFTFVPKQPTRCKMAPLSSTACSLVTCFPGAHEFLQSYHMTHHPMCSLKKHPKIKNTLHCNTKLESRGTILSEASMNRCSSPSTLKTSGFSSKMSSPAEAQEENSTNESFCGNTMSC